jgi:hypothetical protein
MTGWVTTAFALILLGFTLLAVLSAHELAVSASASLASPHKEPPTSSSPNISHKKSINALQNDILLVS